jgi:hypothetical protein
VLIPADASDRGEYRQAAGIAHKRALDAMWLPDNTVSEIGKNSQTKVEVPSLVTVP